MGDFAMFDDDPLPISYIVRGPPFTGTTLICLHGWACRATDFLPLFNRLDAINSGLRLTAIDLPGHGGTSKANCPKPTIRGFAATVLEMLESNGAKSLFLVGHSMGCRIVLDVWRQARNHTPQPPEIAGLIFLDGSHYKLRPSLFAFDSGDARSVDMTDEEKAGKKAEAFQRMFSSQTPAEFMESTLAHVRGMDTVYSNTLRNSQLDYDYTKMDDALAELGEAGLPLLNLQSSDVDAENQRFPMQAGRRSKWMDHLQEKVPQAQQQVVLGSSHFPHVDQPEKVADLIGEFVKRTLGSGVEG